MAYFVGGQEFQSAFLVPPILDSMTTEPLMEVWRYAHLFPGIGGADAYVVKLIRDLLRAPRAGSVRVDQGSASSRPGEAFADAIEATHDGGLHPGVGE